MMQDPLIGPGVEIQWTWTGCLALLFPLALCLLVHVICSRGSRAKTDAENEGHSK
jgi:hypothetical protein